MGIPRESASAQIGISAGSTWLGPAAGQGWAAVGDAAAAFDPLSSHGMTTALWTAITAAEAVPGVLAGKAEDMTRYVGQVAEGVQDFLGSSGKVYAAEQRFTDDPFWRRRRPGGDVEDRKSTPA